MRVKKIFPDWLIGVLLTLFFLFITLTGVLDFPEAIEMKAFDLRARLAAPEDRNPDIELVVISEEDLSELGRFPWPRDILAQGIRNLSLAGARVIALNIYFPEPEESSGLKAIRILKEAYEGLGLTQDSAAQAFGKKLSQALTDLDNDAKLYRAIKEAGNVVLPVYFDTLSSGRDTKAPEFIAKNSYKKVKGTKEEWAVGSLRWFSKLRPLLPSFAEVAAGIGHNNLFTDDDGSIRNQVHVVGYLKDTYFPSFSVSIAKTFKGLKDEDITAWGKRFNSP
ncbi:MAG: CHASE2 domain-containing protein [Deltaproteobacteria bacterium]|nr:CHASE2 domain-containing protein [Deltaproteobacteria bacterium]